MDDVGMFEVFPVLFWSSGNEFNGGCGVGYKANARWSLRRSFTDMKRGHHAAAGCLRQQRDAPMCHWPVMIEPTMGGQCQKDPKLRLPHLHRSHCG
jgi:hypothetical protein